MIVYMKLKRDNSMDFVYGMYHSPQEAERVVKILQATTNAWEFYTK